MTLFVLHGCVCVCVCVCVCARCFGCHAFVRGLLCRSERGGMFFLYIINIICLLSFMFLAILFRGLSTSCGVCDQIKIHIAYCELNHRGDRFLAFSPPQKMPMCQASSCRRCGSSALRIRGKGLIEISVNHRKPVRFRKPV